MHLKPNNGLDLLFWKKPPEPTDREGVGTIFVQSEGKSMKDYVWFLCRLWVQKRPSGTFPTYLYIPRGLEPHLRAWVEGVKGDKAAFITHLFVPVDGKNTKLKIVYIKPREGPRYVYDEASLFLR
jgi:hypothetical protein